MKICIINNLYPPLVRGGAEQVVHRTVTALLEAGHEVVVISSTKDEPSVTREGRLVIYRYKPWNLFFYTDAHKRNILFRFFWHLVDMFHFGSRQYVAKILTSEKPDIVHTHNLMGLGFLIPHAIRALGTPHFHTVHDVQLVEPSGIILKAKEKSLRYAGVPTAMYTWLMKKLIGSPQVVISPSQFLLDFYTERDFFTASTCVLLRNPLTVTPQATEKAYERPLRFLYIGQIEQHKGVKLALEAFSLFRTTHTDAQLDVVGSGSLLHLLQTQMKDEKGVTFHGRIGRDALPALFERTHVTVVPSLCYENSPTVIFESLAFGVPVLASHIEGIAELIQEQENGLTFEAGNAQALAARFAWCAEHVDVLTAMSKKTAQSIAGLSQGEYIERLVSLYQSAFA